MRISALRRALPAVATLLLPLAPAVSHATMPPRSGPVAPEMAAAFQHGLFAVPTPPRGLQTSAARTEWRVPVIRVAFTDSALVHGVSALRERLFDTTGAVPTGSMAEYYEWASGGRLLVTGEVIASVTLPHDRNWYANDSWGVNAISTPNNSYGMFRDAISACDATVDFGRFDLDNDGYVDMLWIVHAGPGGENTTSRRDLWSITSRATSGWNNGTAVETNDLVGGSQTQHIRIDRFTVLPELSSFHPGQLSEIGVYCHEFGHTLGLPDLYDTSSLGGAANVGPGNWSLMSTGAYGGDSASPESPSHLGAWPLLWLGWVDRVRPTRDTTIVLRPVMDGGPLIDFWFQGEEAPEHFLLEARVRDGFDRRLEEEGLLVTQADEAVIGPRIGANTINTGPTPGLRILEGDGDYDLYLGANRGDPNDPLPGGRRRTRIDDTSVPSTRTFLGAPTNISLENITRVGRDVSVTVRVRAPGWQSPRDMAPGAGDPFDTQGPAARMAVSPTGLAWHVASELVAGTPRAVLRERPWQGAWGPPVPLDRGVGAAFEPTIARLPHDDLAVAWIESDQGVGRVLYRARVRGTWTTPRVLTPVTEGCLNPAIAADAKGRVFVAWLELVGRHRELRFLQFLYATPYGQPASLTVPTDVPAAPAITAAGDGHAYVLWPDLGFPPANVYACRFHPDSGMSARFTIGPNSAFARPAVAAAVDSGGVLHTVWQVSPGAGSEIHYQRRPPSGRPSPRDTTLDALGDDLLNPRIALDPMGGLHVAYERSITDGQQVRYKRFHPVLGWDHRATEVSDANDVTASGVQLLPTSNGNVTVAWVGYDGVRQRLRERVRELDGSLVTDVTPAPSPVVVALELGPNPLRPGRALRLSGAGLAAGDAVELIDAAGRRVLETHAGEDGRAEFAADRTAPLPAGLYFARVRARGAVARVVVVR